MVNDYSDTRCLQTNLLIFKFCQPQNKRIFFSTANKSLVGTLMTIGDVTVTIAIMFPWFKLAKAKVQLKHFVADTWIILTLWHVPLSVFTGFHCTAARAADGCIPN